MLRHTHTHTPFKYLAFVTELSSFKTEDLKPDPFFQGQKPELLSLCWPQLTRSLNTYRQLSRNSIPYLNSWARKLPWVSLPFTYPVLCVCVKVFVYIYPWKHSNNLYERVIGNWTSEHSSVLFPTEVYYHTHTTHYPRDTQGTSSTNPKASHHCFRMEHLPWPTPKQSFPVLLSVMKTSRCWLESSQLGTDLEQK